MEEKQCGMNPVGSLQKPYISCDWHKKGTWLPSVFLFEQLEVSYFIKSMKNPEM